MKKGVLILFFIYYFFTISSVFGEEICDYKKVSDGYNQIPYFTYSPDGKEFAFTARKEGEYVMIKDGIEIFRYNFIGKPHYGPNGKSFAFGIKKDGKSSIVKDGVESSKYDSTDNLIYGPNGRSFTFEAEKNGKKIIIKDGVESKPYDKIKYLQYLSDGGLYFVGEKDGRWIIVNDLIEGNIYKDRFDFFNSDDSKPIFNKNINSSVKKEEIKIKNNNYELVGKPIYSFDGESYAFEAKKDGGWIIVKDGKESDKYKHIGNIYYSLDGKRMSFNAQDESLKYSIIEYRCNNTKQKIKKTEIQYIKQNAIAKSNLKNNSKMNKYVPKFEKLIPKLPSNSLKKLNEKISKLPYNARNHKEYKDILNFIEAKVGLELYRRGL